MKHQVSELEGALLDTAVAKAEGRHYQAPSEYAPSSQWAWGGPIIWRERISLNGPGEDVGPWLAYAANTGIRREIERLTMQEGSAPLIAAMRAYVASRFGDEVELP